MAWWPEVAGAVDHVRTMGYWDDYESNTRELLDEGTCWGLPEDHWAAQRPTNYFKYSWKTQWALECGFDSTMLSLGLPAENYGDTWGDGNCQKHIQDILNLESPSGIAIWNHHLPGLWKDGKTWELLKQIRDIERSHSNQTTKSIKTAEYDGSSDLAGISMSKNGFTASIIDAGRYSFSIHDMSGRIIMKTPDAYFSVGTHTVPFNTKGIAKGIYYAGISGNNTRKVCKINMFESIQNVSYQY
jgi:hypothetical protein